ncbi:MAG: hypothetical protein D6719_03400 [Candidatus Dadabacteria bacterium]|nr:MAG: hypothetical protein D6719_03400 [Candidatus Dadabacteria bacterium]
MAQATDPWGGISAEESNARQLAFAILGAYMHASRAKAPPQGNALPDCATARLNCFITIYIM